MPFPALSSFKVITNDLMPLDKGLRFTETNEIVMHPDHIYALIFWPNGIQTWDEKLDMAFKHARERVMKVINKY